MSEPETPKSKMSVVLRVLNALAVAGAVVGAVMPMISAAAAAVVKEHPEAGAGAIFLALLAKIDWSRLKIPPAASALVLAASLVNSGCAHGPKVVACGEDIAIRNRHLAAQVSACLMTNDYRACLTGVIDGSIAVYELVACLVADEAEKMAGEAGELRARAWLEEQRISVAR